MHIVQTYLGAALDGGSTYIYYLAGTAPHQEQFTKEIELRLFRIGRSLGQEVHLFGPHESANDHISAEISGRYGQLWWEMMNQTPGFLILREPFASYDPTRNEGKFISLAGADSENVLDEVERIGAEQAQWAQAERLTTSDRPSIWDEINKRVQIAVNIGPISIGTR
jgi:hypothetical protein